MATGLERATKLQYRPNATKICVLITDAPPHGIETSGDSHPNGDPNAPDLLRTVRQLGAMGVVMYSIGCESSISSYPRSVCFMKWYVPKTGLHVYTLLDRADELFLFFSV